MAAFPPNPPNTPDSRPTGSLEDVFRQKMGEAEVTPRASFWDQLDHELVVQQNEQMAQETVEYRRRLVLHRWVAAACLLLALGFGSWAFLYRLAPNPELAAQSAADASGLAASKGYAGVGTVASGNNAASATASGAAAGLGAGRQQGDIGAAMATGRLLGATQTTAGTSASSAAFRGAEARASSVAVTIGATGAVYSGQLASVLAEQERAYRARQGAAPAASLASFVSGTEGSLAGSGQLEPRFAFLSGSSGLNARPDTLKPALLAVPQLAANAGPASPRATTTPSPKLWRRLRVGGSYAAGAFSPNINFSHTDGRIKADPVTTALRSYYQDEAEDEYRRNLRAGLSQRAALVVTYALGQHWALTSGAEVAEQRATSATTYGFMDGKQVGRGAAGLFNRPASYLAAAPTARTTSYRYRTATVPVTVRYGSTKPGTSLYAKVGAAVSVLFSTRSELEGSPEVTRTYTLKSPDSPYRQVLTSVRGGAGVRYQPATASWSASVGPAAEVGLTTLNAHPNQRVLNQSRPYSIGVEASVEFGSVKPQPVAQ